MATLMRFAPAGLAAALVLSFGCGGDEGDGGGGSGGDDPGPDFALHVLDTTHLEVPAGGDRMLSVVVTAPEGVRHPSVFLRLEGLPEGVNAQSESISSGEGLGTIWVIAADDAPLVYNVEVRIVGSTLSGAERETTFRLSVVPGSGVDGCWDSTYGPLTGVASARVGASPVFSDLVALTDGHLVGVGHSAEQIGWVALWDADGYPARGFGTTGVVTLAELRPERVAPFPGGGFVVAGREAFSGAPALALLLDGQALDPDFGIRPLAGAPGNVRALVLDGAVVHASLSTGGSHVLSRLDLSGSDVFPPVTEGPGPRFAAFAPNGSVVAAHDTAAFRFDAAGHWDTTFGDQGLLRFENAVIGAVLPFGADGGFLVGGSVAAEDGAADAFVTRVLDGAIDPGFFSRLRWRWEGAGQAEVVDFVKLHDGGAALAYEDPDRMLDLVLFDNAGNPRTEYGTPGSEGVIASPYLARSPLAHLVVDQRRNLLLGFVASDDMVAVARCVR